MSYIQTFLKSPGYSQNISGISKTLSHDNKMEDDVNERSSLLGNFRNRNHISSPAASVIII